jgi:hypothetical protein
MTLLIDGYNLMHAAGVVAGGAGPGGLERSRLALLNFIAESVPSETLAVTTVVFDAAGAPPGLPSTLSHRGLVVRFAAGYEDADALIEELVLADSAPRRLLVVSSDHRLHRAARRRRAKAIDSDRWYAAMLRRRKRPPPARDSDALKTAAPLSEGEVEFWLARFGDETLQRQAGDEQIFPPGYAEDEEEIP